MSVVVTSIRLTRVTIKLVVFALLLANIAELAAAPPVVVACRCEEPTLQERAQKCIAT